MTEIDSHERNLTELTCGGIQEIPRVRLLGPPTDRAGIVSFVVEGINAQDISTFLDLKGVATRAGHHCAMPLHQRFGILSSCSASFYLYNTEQEVDFFLQTLRGVVEKLS